MVIAVICPKKWKMNSIDIKAAILQGKDLTRDVYIHPPQEAKSKEIVLKLNLFITWQMLPYFGTTR